jgi:P-type E1-E2 ATPase
MLTGDNEDSARKMASRVGIDHVYAGLSPDEKLKHIKTLGRENDLENLKRSKSPVLMIGDGLNDAAALSAARVGVAISSPASAAASMASDVVVMNYKSGVSSVPLLLRISRYTHHIVLQNVALAAGSILILALPTVLGFIPLWLAVMFHEGSTLLVALNSLRLLRFSM